IRRGFGRCCGFGACVGHDLGVALRNACACRGRGADRSGATGRKIGQKKKKRGRRFHEEPSATDHTTRLGPTTFFGSVLATPVGCGTSYAAMQSVAGAQMSAVESVKTRERLAVGAALFAVYVIWGSTYFAMHLALAFLPPFLMAGPRFLIAGIVLF